MPKIIFSSKIFILFLISIFSSQLFAVDIAILQNQQMSENKAAHNAAVVRRALEITEDEYGPFEVQVVDLTMSNGRLHKFVVEGEIFNTVVIIANQLWDDTTIGLKIPVRLGLLSYRLLLVHEDNLPAFSKVNTIEELGEFSAGLVNGWETTKVFNHHKLNLKTTGHFQGIFSMVDKRRFDYLPRGVYEVYDELKSREAMLKNVVVEPTIALHIPTLTRVYVSPQKPRLARRISVGLSKMLANGDLKKILYKYYDKDLKRAMLQNRKMITLENPYYNHNESLKYKDYLFDLNK